MTLASRYWADLPWPAFRDLPAETVAIIPVASIEQHGPHLPVSVDTTINEGVIARTLEFLAPEVPVLVLPTQRVGLSVEHLEFPGTLTLTPETLLAVVSELGDSVARAGVRKVVFVNSHGGQPQILDIAARRMRIRHQIFAVNCQWSRLGKPAGLVSDMESKYGIHAGHVETALMLALKPERVDMSKARNFASRAMGFANEAPLLSPEAGVPFGWMAQDLHPAGAVGDASLATVETGQKILDYAGQRMAELWTQVWKFDREAWLSTAPDPQA
ncbi:creatinine amidohydrolase [Humitalea rosea]|uniref:Creatinine amidohydrolase n=1 Tax=Humitalea rosea TaxID=990373 RepID=A0A2W7IIC8_9PROT|nr:creatininase family protein [Humitalea rosea]PZW46635.1 creatinine amidohydrolase [Humitalea rosea]